MLVSLGMPLLSMPGLASSIIKGMQTSSLYWILDCRSFALGASLHATVEMRIKLFVGITV